MKRFVLIPFFIFTRAYAQTDNLVRSTPLGNAPTGQIFMLEAGGGNITASIGPDGVLLVDDDFAESHEAISKKLRALGGGAPKFIINTHFHYDHTGGNEKFSNLATIVATNEVRERLKTQQILWGKTHPAVSSTALPRLTFEDRITLNMNGEDVKIVHLKHAHTDGDCVVFFDKAKVASLGDLFFSGMYPIFHSEHAGNLDHFVKALEDVLNRITDEYRIVPGHGPLADKAALRNYLAMIVESRQIVEKAICQGLTLAEIQKKGLPKKWESFSHGYLTTDRWLALVHDALINPKP